MKKINLKGLISERYNNDGSHMEEDYIDYNDMKSLKKLGGGKFDLDLDGMSGTVGWSKKDSDESLYATPSWDGNPGWVPIDDTMGNHYGELDFTKNPKFKGNKKLQLQTYAKAINVALKKFEINLEKVLNKK